MRTKLYSFDALCACNVTRHRRRAPNLELTRRPRPAPTPAPASFRPNPTTTPRRRKEIDQRVLANLLRVILERSMSMS